MGKSRVPETQATITIHNKKVRVSDADLKTAGWNDYTFTPLTQKQLKSPVSATDISQGRIGNCFLLAALGSVVELNPKYLNEIIKMNDDGEAEVTFYHRKGNLVDKITYIIDATKLNKMMLNNHDHDAIYILEKAYALHRLMTEPLTDKIEKQKAKGLPVNNLKVKVSAPDSEDLEMNLPMLDYISTLAGGTADDVYAALHLSSHYQPILDIVNSTHHKTFPILIDNLWDIWQSKKNMPEIIGKNLEYIFNNNRPMIINFITGIQALNLQEKNELVASFSNLETLMDTFKKDNTISFTEVRKRISDTLHLPARLKVLQKEILEIIVRELPPRKRGMGEYNEQQEILYKYIHDNLKHNHLASLGSKEHVHTNTDGKEKKAKGGEEVYKGLLGGHAYQVADCYERDNLKFIVVRNPWASYVRDYEYKHKKTADGKDITVLSAHSKSQLTDLTIPKDKPRNLHPIKNSARGTTDEKFEQEFKKHGYFEIELTDLTKRFNSLYVTDVALPAQNENKVNFVVQIEQRKQAKRNEKDFKVTPPVAGVSMFRKQGIENKNPKRLHKLEEALKTTQEQKNTRHGK